MRILITNHSLAARAGTELVVYEIARGLQSRGHEVAAYSSTLGEVAELLSASSIPVLTQPGACPFKPDLIHAQHHLDAMTALLAFPDTPAVYHIHGGVPWVERPPVHPRILHYIAMCQDLADSTRINLGLDEDQITTAPNWVDTHRFQGTRTPPARPGLALLFGGGLGEPGVAAKLRPAFEHHQIRLETTADWTETDRRTPELALPRYDIVLSSGRSALEAMASGCAVVIANYQSCIGWARADNFLNLQHQNFSPKRADPGFDASILQSCLAAYDPEAAKAATEMTRTQCSMGQAIDRLSALHEKVAQSWQQRSIHHNRELLTLADAERKAALVYLRQLAVAVRDVETLHVTNRMQQKQVESVGREKDKLAAEIARLEAKIARSGDDLNLVKNLRSHWLGRLALTWCRRSMKK